jgi:hypothetical protein
MVTLVELIVRRIKSLGVRSRLTEAAFRLLYTRKKQSIATFSIATHIASLSLADRRL